MPGGGGQKPPLHKSESIEAIVTKLGGWVEHYNLINFNVLHAIMTSSFSPKSVFFSTFFLFLCRRPTQPKTHD